MPHRILIIDDEPAILGLVKYTLEKGGFEVRTCDSGREAWDEIVKVKPDLLLLDVMLPGIDGYSLETQLAQDESTKALPVILLTALESVRPLFERFPQVVGYMTKPFKPAELLQAVVDALAKTKPAGS
jgi:DNA-binding response OmpR family regulator